MSDLLIRGPLQLGPFPGTLLDRDGQPFARLNGPDTLTTAQANAYARLFVASEALLVACKWAAAYLKDVIPDHGANCREEDLWNILEMAITKAEGNP